MMCAEIVYPNKTKKYASPHSVPQNPPVISFEFSSPNAAHESDRYIYLQQRGIVINKHIYYLLRQYAGSSPPYLPPGENYWTKYRPRFRSSDVVHEARGGWQSMAPGHGCVGIHQALMDTGEIDTVAQYASTRTWTRVPLPGDGKPERRHVGDSRKDGGSPCSPGDPSLGVASGKIRAACVFRVPRENSRKSRGPGRCDFSSLEFT